MFVYARKISSSVEFAFLASFLPYLVLFMTFEFCLMMIKPNQHQPFRINCIHNGNAIYLSEQLISVTQISVNVSFIFVVIAVKTKCLFIIRLIHRADILMQIFPPTFTMTSVLKPQIIQKHTNGSYLGFRLCLISQIYKVQMQYMFP